MTPPPLRLLRRHRLLSPTLPPSSPSPPPGARDAPPPSQENEVHLPTVSPAATTPPLATRTGASPPRPPQVTNPPASCRIMSWASLSAYASNDWAAAAVWVAANLLAPKWVRLGEVLEACVRDEEDGGGGDAAVDEVGVCMDVVEVLGDVGGDLDRASTEEVVFAAATGGVGAGGTYGFRRGRQRAERKAVMAVPVGARERRRGVLGDEAVEGMVAWSWKRAAPRNQREKHLSGGNLGDEYEQERLCPLQALSGDFFWEVDLEANDFNCPLWSHPARKHAHTCSFSLSFMSMSDAAPTLKADEEGNFYSWNKDRVRNGRKRRASFEFDEERVRTWLLMFNLGTSMQL